MIKELVSPSPNTHPSNRDVGRLDSWKEIANYFRREVRTVQLWEKREGLPVHRHFHKQLGSVYAFRSELDAWNQRVSVKGVVSSEEPTPAETRPEPGRTTIHVEPLRHQTPGEQALCEAISAQTIALLKEINPRRLGVVEVAPLQATSQASRERKVVSDSVSQDPPCGYRLHWTMDNTVDNPGNHHSTGLRVHVQLVSLSPQVVVWSQVYRCPWSDVNTITAYLADQIVLSIWLKVISTPPRFAKCSRERTAKEAYLKGRYFWKQRNEEALRKALQCFEAAIQQNPDFALPYSGVADSLTLLSFYEIVPPSQAMPAARRAALKAIELDPDLAEGHASLADIKFHFDRDWQGADLEYRKAIECNPSYALGYHWYANLLAARGQHEAAHIAIMRALELDPVSLITLVWAGVTAHLARRFDDAIEHYQSALELDPEFTWAHMYLAQALEQKGNFKQAVREFENTIKLTGGSNCVLAMKAHAYAIAGDKTSARQILHGLKSASNRKCMPSYDIAATHAALGESRQMGLWLNRACTERNMKLFTLMHDPRFDQLRHHSEFKEVVASVGLSRYMPIHAAAR
jgi:tetratricopeptide (TPR) repeat protein